MKTGYANRKREELFEKLKTVFEKITNSSTGIEANLSKKSLDKMTSAKALEKSIANGHKIYSIELDEINKASERFQGLSDAAETANRATKTPHIDNSVIADNAEKSSTGEAL